MKMPEQRMVDFIREHHIFTLAVTKNVYEPETNLFIFTSDEDTRHIMDAEESGNYHLAGAIALETKTVSKIRGIQFTGMIRKLGGEERKPAKKLYVKAFPIARLAKLTLWSLAPDFIKMTDNRLGFGKKLIWRNSEMVK
jgi:uncharacterized protein YhbP (UPF0306 family)